MSTLASNKPDGYPGIEQDVYLLGSRASPGAKEVAALSRLRAEAPAAVALRGAVELGELLAVVRNPRPSSHWRWTRSRLPSPALAP